MLPTLEGPRTSKWVPGHKLGSGKSEPIQTITKMISS